MMILAALTAGLAHFLIGGLWYSPLMFSRIWMRGLGLTESDIKEGHFNMWLALSASAFASFAQARENLAEKPKEPSTREMLDWMSGLPPLNTAVMRPPGV